jgi:arylsulfatase A-like enzyme
MKETVRWWMIWGVVAGLVEGVLLMTFQKFGWLPWEMRAAPVSTAIISVSTAVTGLLFLAIGGAVAVLFFKLKRQVPLVVAAAAPALAFFDWLVVGLSWRVSLVALLVLAMGLATLGLRTTQRFSSMRVALARAGSVLLVVALTVVTASLAYGSMRESIAARRSAGVADPDAPNVLLVILDALRSDHVGAYGYPRETSPTIDSLAREGTLFRDARATSSWSLPTHASLFTGQLPSEHRAAWCQTLSDSAVTLAEVLARKGYRTAGFSGNFLFFNRAWKLDQGFQHFEDVSYGWRDAVSRTIPGRLFDRGFEYVESRPKAARYLLRPLRVRRLGGSRSAGDMTDGILRWTAGVRSRPFFVAVNFFDLHGPDLPPEPYRDMFAEERGRDFDLASLPYGGRYKLRDEQLQYLIDTYDGALRYVDTQLSRLLDGLRARGETRRLLVIVTADHGEMFREHGLYGHEVALWSYELQVPLVMSMPGSIPAGRVVTTPVSAAGIPSTVISLLGHRSLPAFTEPSLSPLWSSDASVAAEWPAPVSEVSRFSRASRSAKAGWKAAVATPRWTYVRSQRVPELLFDRVNDAGESRNLAADPALADTLNKMRTLLSRRLTHPPPCSEN